MQRILRPRPILVLALAATLPLLAACGDDEVIAPQFQPEVANLTDSFQFQATGLTGVTQTLQYTWANTGISADIDQSCSMTQGTASLTVRDADGTFVYSKDLSQGGSFISQDGTTGNWVIRVTVSGVHGDLNFRVQKRTP